MGEEIANQTRELTERINRKVADKLAAKNRELAAEEKASGRDRGGNAIIVQSPGSSGRSFSSSHHGESDGWVPVAIVAIIFTYLIIRAFMAPFTQRNGGRRGQGAVMTTTPGLTPEELALLQRMQKTLTQMENRVEALETILIDQNNRPKTASVARTNL